jgi:CheY-like chemotaxis protein
MLEMIAASDLKVELLQPHGGSPEYIEILKILFSWPVIILVVFLLLLYKSGDSLKKFLENLGEFTFKAGGLEATAKRQQIEAAALLGAASAASAARQTPASDQQSPPDESTLRQVAHVVSEATRPSVVRRFGEAVVLWVDDRPSNNIYERKSLEALGVRFVISTSTEDALGKVRENHFDAIISDMGRPPDPQAGYTLLDQLRSSGIEAPFIIYAGSNAQKHKDEAKHHGALGSTNNPRELFQLVTAALAGRRP